MSAAAPLSAAGSTYPYLFVTIPGPVRENQALRIIRPGFFRCRRY
jgi:hypothetical protein